MIIITFQTGGAEQFDFGPKEYHVTLSFQQAAMGVCKLNIGWSKSFFSCNFRQVTKDMYVSVMDTCGSCNGSGAEKGTKPER